VYKEAKVERDQEKSALLEALRVKLRAQLDLAEVCGGVGRGWGEGLR